MRLMTKVTKICMVFGNPSFLYKQDTAEIHTTVDLSVYNE